jgi:hypothetical protein
MSVGNFRHGSIDEGEQAVENDISTLFVILSVLKHPGRARETLEIMSVMGMPMSDGSSRTRSFRIITLLTRLMSS